MNLVKIKLAGEGHLDISVLRRLVIEAGFEPAEEYGRRGKSFVNTRLPNWNKAAEYSPWIVLRDLDCDAPCAAELVSKLLPRKAKFMCFRVVVPAIESWLLADHEACVLHLGLRKADIPSNVEEMRNVKRHLLIAATRSNIRDVKLGLVAKLKTGELVEGDNYNAILANFVSTNWRPEIAERASPSLAKARLRLRQVVSAATTK